jgi:hypothetical protein
MALYDALCGIDGTVAWTAGPSAALAGVIGMETCDAGDCTPTDAYEEPFDVPLV